MTLPPGGSSPKKRPTPWPTAVFLAAAGSVPIAGWIGQGHWLLDLFNHFQAQYAVFLLTCCGLLLLRRRPRLAAFGACFLLIPVLRLAPLWIPPAPSAAPTLRVATFNVLGSNDRHADTLGWIRRERPDILYLCETTEGWIRSLRSLEDLYPHMEAHPLDGSFGLMLLSRFPIRSSEISHHGHIGIPLIDAVIEPPGGPVRVLGAHPVPPVSRFWAAEHGTYMAALHQAAADSALPTLVIGDLNATRWGHRMRPLLAAGYRDSACGRGYSATWSRGNPLLAIPIDHILSRGLGPCVCRHTGPDLGSDHRPVIAGFPSR